MGCEVTGLVEGLIIAGFVGTFASGTGVAAYVGRRLMAKLDGMDKVLRGDGNGNPGLGEQIRGVHTELTRVKTGLDAHLEDSTAWTCRIVRNENRITVVETRCALLDCEEDSD